MSRPFPSPARFDGKIVLVTGAAGGIGEAIARRFAAQGAKLIVTDVDQQNAARVEQSIADKGGAAVAQWLDVTSEKAWAAAMAVATGMGGLDILVNNAGFGNNATILDETLEGWRLVNACVAEGCFLGMKAAIPLMIDRGGGAIVNISSVAAQRGDAYSLAYCSAKAAVGGLTRSTAIFCARKDTGIRVNALQPGAVDTSALRAMDHSDDGRVLARLAASSPLSRLGHPDEIANAALFLASDEASFMTGQTITVDGGMTA